MEFYLSYSKMAPQLFSFGLQTRATTVKHVVRLYVGFS